MSYTYSLPRNSLLRRALRLCGVVAQGEEPDAAQISEAAEALEAFLKGLQSECNFAYGILERSFASAANQAVYTLSTDVLDVFDVWVEPVLGDGQAPQVRIIPADFYDRQIQNKTQSGTPNLAHVSLIATPTITLWPVPFDTSVTVHYRMLQKILNTAGSSSGMPVPEQWYDTLVYGLASRLADEYQLEMEKCQWLTTRFEQMKAKAMEKVRNPTDTLFIYPV